MTLEDATTYLLGALMFAAQGRADDAMAALDRLLGSNGDQFRTALALGTIIAREADTSTGDGPLAVEVADDSGAPIPEHIQFTAAAIAAGGNGDALGVPAPAMPLTVCDRWGHQASTTDPAVCLDCRQALEQAA